MKYDNELIKLKKSYPELELKDCIDIILKEKQIGVLDDIQYTLEKLHDVLDSIRKSGIEQDPESNKR